MEASVKLRLGRESSEADAGKGWLYLLRDLLSGRERLLGLLLERSSGWKPGGLGDEACLDMG